MLLVQLVNLTRGGEPVRMGKRSGEFVTLREVVDEVGADATRFFFLLRKADSQLDFDLELAKQQSTDNPVFYVQYAHARIASVLRQAAEAGVAIGRGPPTSTPLGDAEVELLRVLATLSRRGRGGGARARAAPHRLLRAGARRRVPSLLQSPPHPDRRSRRSRRRGSRWSARVQQVLRSALGLPGVAAPERM